LISLLAVFEQLKFVTGEKIVVPIIILFAIMVLSFGLGLYFYLKPQPPPSDTVIPSPGGMMISIRRSKFKVLPATESDIREAAKLAKKTYELENDRIPEAVMLNWFCRNKKGFYILKNLQGEFLGNLDLLGFTPETYRDFAAGNLLERNIQAHQIYSDTERDQIRIIHIESFVVSKDYTDGHYRMAVWAFVSQIPSCIREMCSEEAINGNQIKVCAISANPDIADRLLEMGAECIRKAEERKDKHNFLLIDLKKLSEGIERLAHDVSAISLQGGN